jgi:hypothetical protein
MDTAIIVALLAGTVSAGTAVYTNRLGARLEEQRHERTKAENAQALLALYRDPLLRASFDLQSRLFNIVAQGFLGKYYTHDGTREYASLNTAYVVAEYLGWVEILRQEVRFLDIGSEKDNAELTLHLDAVRRAFLSDTTDPAFRLFNGEQRAIGEIMTCATEGSPRQVCLGYARFVERQDEPAFAQWFTRLRSDVERLAAEPGRHDERLRGLQHALVDLIVFLDEGKGRLPGRDLSKLP